MSDCIQTLVALASKHRLARIAYQKLGESSPHWRVIEAYRFLERETSLMIHAWQVDPQTDQPCWRCFRCDRIVDISDGGGVFEPRRPVRLALGEVDDFMRLFRSRPQNAVDRYRDYLRKAIADHQLTEKERVEAGNLAERVARKDMKVVHAQVFAEVLFDVLLDHSISEAEDEFIVEVRGFMEEVGWAP